MAIFVVKAQGETEHYSAKNEKHLREQYFEMYGEDVNLIESIEEITLEETKEISVYCEEFEDGELVSLFQFIGGMDSDEFELLCSTNF